MLIITNVEIYNTDYFWFKTNIDKNKWLIISDQ